MLKFASEGEINVEPNCVVVSNIEDAPVDQIFAFLMSPMAVVPFPFTVKRETISGSSSRMVTISILIIDWFFEFCITADVLACAVVPDTNVITFLMPIAK